MKTLGFTWCKKILFFLHSSYVLTPNYDRKMTKNIRFLFIGHFAISFHLLCVVLCSLRICAKHLYKLHKIVRMFLFFLSAKILFLLILLVYYVLRDFLKMMVAKHL